MIAERGTANDADAEHERIASRHAEKISDDSETHFAFDAETNGIPKSTTPDPRRVSDHAQGVVVNINARWNAGDVGAARDRENTPGPSGNPPVASASRFV